MAFSLVPIESGDVGAAQTVEWMRRLVTDSQRVPAVRVAVEEILRGLPPRSPRLDILTITDWVRSAVRYTADPSEVEYIQSPQRMLEEIRRTGTVVGDCDDMAVLLAALLESAGYRTRFVVSGPSGSGFSHVYVEVAEYPGGPWIAVDPTRRDGGLGEAPGSAGRRGVEMLGEDYLSFGESTDGAPAASFESFLSQLGTFVKETAPTVLGVLERTGVYKPVAGYSPSGVPIYSTAVLPASPAQAAYTGLTQSGPLGIPMLGWVLLGVGALAVFSRRRV